MSIVTLRRPHFALVLALPLALPALAAAQNIEQGEARITATADVRMSLESGPATGSVKLGEIGAVVGSKIGDVRRCYRERTEQSPTVRGRLRLNIELRPGGGRVEVARDELNDRPLTTCVLRALRAANYASLRPPGSAFVVLDFDNSAADGVERTRERRAVEDTAEVTTSADGQREARGGTPDGLISFRVVGADDAQLQAVHRTIRATIPALLDCRRKAARRQSPAGEMEIDLRLARGGRGQATVRRNTVADDRGPRCVTQALGRARYEGASPGRVRVILTFTERADAP
ncbi:MAG: hypothetical protein KF901_12450 [Myxococcales bacterium]|nr:hypothetical protein [Myxococcales bacterium]